VGESFEIPHVYFDNNIGGTACLLAAMQQVGVNRIVFSSSCTVYGQPDAVPIDESAPVKPAENPYGYTKQTCERMLSWLADTTDLRFSALRYFNAAGAWDPLGEDHDPETHLIPCAINATLGLSPPLQVFGADYPTRDGTCVRDYIHVADLASAHLLAAQKLIFAPARNLADLRFINLGSATGNTVLEVLSTIERLGGRPVPHSLGPRRAGDAPELVASNAKARTLLGWVPSKSSLDLIVTTALAHALHKANP